MAPGARSFLLALAAALVACGPGEPPPADPEPPPTAAPIRLHDLYADPVLRGRVDLAAEAARSEWRFDASPPAGGWSAGPGVADLAVREGRLVGRSTGAVPLIHFEAEPTGDDDAVHAVEVRARISAGSRLAVRFQPALEPGLEQAAATADDDPFWGASTPIVAGDAVRTYTVPSPLFPVPKASARHVMLRPTDAADASFAIESVRVVFRREHLASIPSGASWSGLGEIYHESLIARPGETLAFELALPARPRLAMELGTPVAGAVTFRAALQPRDGGPAATVLEHTVTTPDRWERVSADLGAWAGTPVELALSVHAEEPGALGLFGAAAVRDPGPPSAERPQGVVFVLADTLRRDHLDLYGYARETAPGLSALARGGAVFESVVAQASWTKVSAPSLFTSLHPSSHGVTTFAGRLPDAAVTLAEVFREAGYATLGFSSVFFTGRFSNLQQGYESFHELSSIPERTAKTARTYVDRLLPWLDAHRDVPFFVLLHVFDPHDPYEPRSPWNRSWADAGAREEHLAQLERVRPLIRHPLRRAFGMPSADELREAGIDPVAFVDHDVDWYDGSILGMDAELRRVLERLRALGLGERTLVVFTSDHGEEFHEHGQMFHGQSLYAELLEVPLLMWGPGVPAGVRVAAPVQSLDVMPTLLELAGLPAPAGLQGRSLEPLLAGAPADAEEWRERALFAEKPPDATPAAPARGALEAVAVHRGRWKLVHNGAGREELPEFELFDRERDPGDRENLAAEHPDVVERLRAEIETWRSDVAAARLPSEEAASADLGAEELERLRDLGYVR